MIFKKVSTSNYDLIGANNNWILTVYKSTSNDWIAFNENAKEVRGKTRQEATLKLLKKQGGK
jgi:hypothetical protein